MLPEFDGQCHLLVMLLLVNTFNETVLNKSTKTKSNPQNRYEYLTLAALRSDNGVCLFFLVCARVLGPPLILCSPLMVLLLLSWSFSLRVLRCTVDSPIFEKK